MELPPNVYYQLLLPGNVVIAVNKPLPGTTEGEGKVWFIVFRPQFTTSEIVPGEEGETDGEDQWTTPAKYFILMRDADGSVPKEMQIHEIFADKVLLTSRMPVDQLAACEEFNNLLNAEVEDDAKKIDLKEFLKRVNGQQPAASANP